ncbi:phenylalanine-tRNA synthetase [Eremomyces bilateralis CBS 781.70]|uniref:Phenylalanine--tRNA ligase, mitochondrial n=1 Tax=Eremomyces bilateralis CBS 781.70 TaxID=1392243 RepID=A0A6G1G3G1_9PEZI|nr:phenylalanine-tRNA synthetase [Eremomyces bilateralis CBS 781.70]KAF1812647.1 phenylalanine-tRNA synthetase [Eremomyces bilateralis CBS 781.70]
METFANIVQDARDSLKLLDKSYPTDSWTNVPSTISRLLPRRLHLQPDHPITITRRLIESRFPSFATHNSLSPIVSVHQNFDSLGFPVDHPGRSRTDTYYVNQDTVLRTHTSAHQADTFASLGASDEGFLISADVYRRDAVDRSHYPVFHQMEGAMMWSRDPSGSSSLSERIWADVEKLRRLEDVEVSDPNPTVHPERNPLQKYHELGDVEAIAAHLKRSLEDVVREIFAAAKAVTEPGSEGEALKVRWVEAYFPFTSPSWELEVYWQGDWLEVLGCGVVKQEIMIEAGAPDKIGWAFGLGLERIAMLLCSIPDIRLFWSQDERFLSQFREKRGDDGTYQVNKFVPFSKHPPCPKDVSFWLRGTSSAGGGTKGNTHDFHENDIMELVRDIAGDIVEDVSLVDEFTHPKTARKSMCYRVIYRSLERTLTNEEVNGLHEKVRGGLVERLGVELR